MEIRVIRCETWENLIETARRYAELGYICEVKGWEAIRDNKLTIRTGDKEWN